MLLQPDSASVRIRPQLQQTLAENPPYPHTITAISPLELWSAPIPVPTMESRRSARNLRRHRHATLHLQARKGSLLTLSPQSHSSNQLIQNGLICNVPVTLRNRNASSLAPFITHEVQTNSSSHAELQRHSASSRNDSI
jgi:hypothetical protein